MNKEEILNKYIDLIDKGYCSDCNELNCIDNFPHAKITHAIIELQQENQQLKSVIKEIREYIKEKEKDGTLWTVKSTDEILEMLDKYQEGKHE